MREIKFRVSAGDTTVGYEELHEGSWYHSENGTDWESGTYKNPHYKRWQFTGLKDKNGVEIYEGDSVVRADQNLTVTSQVGWDEVEARFGMDDGADGWWTFYGDTPDYYEVIGTAYAHPNYLKTNSLEGKTV